MAFAAGTHFGAYQVTALIGVGGMGEVYQATDTALGREVAIKVLPESFAASSDRVVRLEREAKTLALLNHTNIGQIFGLERRDGTTALVMELVEGPTLAHRLMHGAIPADEALNIAMQIADALEAAHAVGIVHRDLKPANIKLRPDGTVKVLDFGIAKPLGARAISGSQGPALTAPAMTEAGILLGTAAYMSPEQARGKPVDERTDIWAFGCLLYEMLTGKSAFAGDDPTATLARVLERNADMNALPKTVTPAVRHTIGLCLEKNVHRRVADIRDVKLVLEGVFATPATHVQRMPRYAQPSLIAVGIAAAFLLGATGALWLWPGATSEPRSVSDPFAPPMTNTVIDLQTGAALALGSDRPLHGFDSPAVAIAPDGSRLAYVGESSRGKVLYLREMAGGEFRLLDGTDGVLHAFFSPDGRSIGFLTETQLKRLSLDTGAVAVLANTNQPVQGWWHDDGLIYFSDMQATVLSRVPADGSGRVSRVTDDVPPLFRFSDVLPNGHDALVYRPVTSISGDYADVVLFDTQTRESTTLLHNGYGARFVPPGYLLFGRGGNLMGVRYAPEQRSTVGEEFLVANNVGMESLFGIAHADVSDNGLIAYVPGGDLTIGRLAWVDRDGHVEFVEGAPERIHGMVDLSPDGTRIAVEVADVNDHVWIYDTVRRQGRRLSANESYGQPHWRPPAGRELSFITFDGGRTLIQNVDDGSAPMELGADRLERPWFGRSWSPDGKAFVFETLKSQGFATISGEIHDVDLGSIWINGFSPDGAYFAYTKTQNRSEIWVASYPDAATQRLISDSGIETVWCPCGELFYRDGNRWYSTRVTTEPELAFDPPRLSFDTDFIDTAGISYAISPDGQRLLVVKRSAPDLFTRLHVVTNWMLTEPPDQRD